MTSATRMIRINSASMPSLCGLFFAARDKSVRKGNANCRMTIPSAITPHPPCLRATYQTVSSGRLPDQMIKYCEKAKYIHSITRAISKLPQSWKCEVRTTAFMGSQRASQDITRIPKASALKLHEATKISPKIVDDQAGSSDITQSIAAKVIVII